jgi:predicted membrane channel-forming protein YqfA (hemolysin III family)
MLTLVGILLTLCAVGLVVWGIFKIFPMLGLPEPINTIVYVLLVVVIGVVALMMIWGMVGGGGMPFRHWSLLLPGPAYASAATSHLLRVLI